MVTPTTNDQMQLNALVGKSAHLDFLGDMISIAARRRMPSVAVP